MRLYLVRHAQSLNNALALNGRYHEERVDDPPLTEVGLKQAEHVANWLANSADAPNGVGQPFGVTHIYCSAMTRAMETAHALSKTLKVKPEVWLDAHEIGGLFEEDESGKCWGTPGITRTQATERFEGYILPERLTEDGWWGESRGRETYTEAISRAVKVLDLLKERFESDESIVLVSHGDFLDLLIKGLMNQLPMSQSHLYYLHYNTAITRFDFSGDTYREQDQMRLHYLNRVDHLPQEMRTW